jgi:hypothetical protein
MDEMHVRHTQTSYRHPSTQHQIYIVYVARLDIPQRVRGGFEHAVLSILSGILCVHFVRIATSCSDPVGIEAVKA